MKKIEQTESTQEQLRDSEKNYMSTLEINKKNSERQEDKQSRSMSVRKSTRKSYHSKPQINKRTLNDKTDVEPELTHKIFKRRQASSVLDSYSNKSQVYHEQIKKSRDGHYRNKSYSVNSSYLPVNNNNASRRKSLYGILETKHPKFEKQIDMAMYTLCRKKETQFFSALNKQSESALEVLLELLNYTIDYNDCDRFLLTIKTIGDYYFSHHEYYNAMKFYNQMREAAILQKRYDLTALGLIFTSKCTLIANLYEQTIIILKKALEYSWLSGIKQIQLKVYDQLGQAYYKMGDLIKAKKYHNKYGNAEYEEKDSPLRFLSKKKIEELENHNIEQYFNGLDIVYLVMLSLPFKSVLQLPSLINNLENELRSKIPEQPKPKIGETIIDNVDYFSKKMLKNWMFKEALELPERSPRDESQKNDNFSKTRKNWYIDFKMNQYLRSKGIKPLHKITNETVFKFEYKQSLENKIERKIKEPGLSNNWYEQIVKEVVADQKRKVNRINSPICIKKSSKNMASIHGRNRAELFLKYFKVFRDLEGCKKLRNILLFMHEP